MYHKQHNFPTDNTFKHIACEKCYMTSRQEILHMKKRLKDKTSGKSWNFDGLLHLDAFAAKFSNKARRRRVKNHSLG